MDYSVKFQHMYVLYNDQVLVIGYLLLQIHIISLVWKHSKFLLAVLKYSTRCCEP